MLKYIFIGLVLFATTACAQDVIFGKKYYRYTAVTNNETIYDAQDMVQISGKETRVKVNRYDSLATKRAPQGWLVVVGVDSVRARTLNLTDIYLEEETEYTYYYSILISLNNGMTAYSKGTNGTFTTPLGFGSNQGLYTSDGNKLYTSDNNRLIGAQ